MGPNVSTFYDEPVHLVKGEGVWVWDAGGNRYLDCYNNVPHVGHCHPTVVEAICRQAATLNTHTRYLHEGILDYIERLTGTFAEPLSTGILTCTGSEANDIALRMAEAVTGKRGVIATDHTYHGNTTAVSQLSRTNPPTGGYGSHVRHVPAPDSYRPLGGEPGEAHASAFATKIEEAIASLEKAGHGFSAIIICPYFANEGFPDLPAGWLDPASEVVRWAGGIIIADEVQPGFGRIGTHMWGHQRIGLTPDIVTLGKPMANGHPVGGVVTAPDVMAAFRKSFRYFNTFGGNPVSCAAASAVLDVLEDENLMRNADAVGAYARDGLKRLAERHAVIGDVRGSGLFFGAEMVLDRATKEPATQYTARVANEMRRRGILLNRLGIHYNTLKIRPPMPFTRDNADLLLSTLDAVLTDLPVDA
ncbi:aminotransferase class III-fold pyridoxal phosphate-dependent enzyme [Nitratireductor sp. XY-223]|uniref:aspartate aminotransferase family protein n=1 Tax=Nitratireductor sp. XY-223 TaxID=2561926 RepID=UPI0010A9F01B|nr:aminotransferase class III-fold pyridoxal phosphate-dependent enzyme [Nitratireductor sp. XY-223]